MENDLNDMMVFLAVVETGSFTLAADRLSIPKANVSRKVSRLEQQLNITLLERSTRSQHLTEAGKRYLVHCKRVHEELDLAKASVSELLHSYKGELKVGASISTGQQILRPALATFMHQYPELNVQLNLVNRRVDFIEEGFDVVIRVGRLEDSMLMAKNLGTATRSLFASPAYLAKHGKPQTVTELLTHQLLVMNPTNNDPTLNLVSTAGEAFNVNCKPRLLVDDFAILKQSLVDGLGIAVLPDYMSREEVASGQLVRVLPDWGMESVDVYALYPRHRAKIPKVRAFLDFAIKIYGDALKLK
ncbi:LysR family transcriptional regulator [Moritella sp. F3]|uniref:LysR family transcriptional regulator n=1 Tax=Moritella sp. F3 TaxID=2718882 RepID=UPI0018E1D690|nr:LysR family transcriptional regulator [Moritella sp. F3]GIC76304.1 LysR family transcriptional regulator [Moritella sp. F1]GIC82908.1 LysR family transcriptional regulator [Moritella sp. F3]